MLGCNEYSKKVVTVYCYQISIFCLDFNLKWLKDLDIQKFVVNENLWYKVFVFIFLAKPIDKAKNLKCCNKTTVKGYRLYLQTNPHLSNVLIIDSFLLVVYELKIA